MPMQARFTFSPALRKVDFSNMLADVLFHTEGATAEAAESVKAFFKNDLRDFLLAFIGSLIDFKFDWIIIDAKKILILLNW